MHPTNLPRRSVVLGGSLGLAAAASAPTPALADAPVAEEHWALKGAVKLYLYRKRMPGPAVRPVLFLVHGSSFSGRGGFDLDLPGYSFMDEFARAGFDVWTMDHENYGRSSRTEGNSDIRSGVEDLKAGLPVVERVTGQRRVRFYGQSSGAIRLGVFAMEAPERVERMVLDAFTWTGEGAPEIMRRRADVKLYQEKNYRPMTRAGFEAIFSRDDPSTFDPRVPAALAAYELALGDRAPSGTYLDMAIHLPLVDPARIQCPVLMTRAEFDGNATDAELLAFFARRPNRDRQFAMIRGIAHVAVLGINRGRIWHAMREFWTMPDQIGA